MNRRDALGRLGKISTLGLVGVLDLTSLNVLAAEQTTSTQAFSSSFSDFKAQLGPTKIRFDKPLPADLTGTLYRNGPALMQRGTVQYHHWFDGDGMIQSFQLAGQTLTHQGNVIQTDKYQAEEKAGKFLWSSFGTEITDSLSPQKPDDLNVANISVLPMGNEILALWEAGSPWRIDPKTLETLGRKTFSPETDGLPFSAHPRIDVDGRIWNFGYLSGSDQLILYELTPKGSLKRASLVESTKTNMVHDFAMTDQYLIFLLMPIDFTPPSERGIPSFLSMLAWDDDSSVDVLVIDKNTLSVVRRIEMPPFFAFHFGNAWEDGNQIRIESARAPEFHSLMKQIEDATLGKPIIPDQTAPAAMDIVVDLNTGSIDTQALPFNGADFPCFDDRYSGQRTNTLVMLERSTSMPKDVLGLNKVVIANRNHSSIQSWTYGKTTIAEEHLFVPKPSAKEGEGWLIGTAYDWRDGKTTLSVFDSSTLTDGPVASATLPYSLPLGLHGKFVATNP